MSLDRVRWAYRARTALRFAFGLLVACSGALASAQQEPPAEEKIPAPEDIVLPTKDMLQLTCTFYPGTKKKESVPVVLLHDYKGNRRDWENLALQLQKEQGFAVIVPDLRGHGDSTNKGTQKLEATGMAPQEFQLMYKIDLERVKTFLMEKHNAGQLNIDKLSVCGCGMGALVGMLWSAQDWSWPILATGKQGQDVKAVAMISPDFAFKSLSMAEVPAVAGGAVREVQSRISIYITCGASDSKALGEATRVNNLFKVGHQLKKDEDKDLFFDKTMKTKLQSTKLLSEKSLPVAERIIEFLDLRAASQPFPWVERRTQF